MSFPFLYITAKDRTLSDVIRLFMYLRDYEYYLDEDAPDCWRLRLSKDIPPEEDYDNSTEDDDADSGKPVKPPVHEYDEKDNLFAGWTIEQLEDFLAMSEAQLGEATGQEDFIIADDETFREMTVVYMQQRAAHTANNSSGERFIRIRVPAVSVTNMFANLSTGNMGWEAYLGDDYWDEAPKPGWQPRFGIDDAGHERKNMKQAEEAFQQLDPNDEGEDVDLVVSRYCAACLAAEKKDGKRAGGPETGEVEDEDEEGDDGDGKGDE